MQEYASLIDKYNRCGFPHTQICAMIIDLHLGKGILYCSCSCFFVVVFILLLFEPNQTKTDAMVKSLSLFAECHKRGHTGADFSKAIVLVGLDPETVLPFLDGRRVCSCF